MTEKIYEKEIRYAFCLTTKCGDVIDTFYITDFGKYRMIIESDIDGFCEHPSFYFIMINKDGKWKIHDKDKKRLIEENIFDNYLIDLMEYHFELYGLPNAENTDEKIPF